MPFRPDLGPKPRLGYTDSRIARAAELRPDAKAIATLSQDLGAGAYVIGGDWIVMKKGSPLHEPLFTMAEAQALSAPTEREWGGVSACVADPDGFRWDLVHNPNFRVDADGTVHLGEAPA